MLSYLTYKEVIKNLKKRYTLKVDTLVQANYKYKIKLAVVRSAYKNERRDDEWKNSKDYNLLATNLSYLYY